MIFPVDVDKAAFAQTPIPAAQKGMWGETKNRRKSRYSLTKDGGQVRYI